MVVSSVGSTSIDGTWVGSEIVGGVGWRKAGGERLFQGKLAPQPIRTYQAGHTILYVT